MPVSRTDSAYNTHHHMIRHATILISLSLLTILATSCRHDKSAQGEQTTQAFYDTSAGAKKETAKQNTTVLYEIPAPLSDRPEQIIRRKGYTTSYNSSTKVPNWVAWHLTKNHTYGSVQRSDMVFTEDSSVKAPRATDNDYYSSRFDRGHMCPAGDNKWDKDAMAESFLFTNICPQNHGLNKYEWNDLETLCRDWARKYGAIDIVCGPLYTQDPNQQKTIGRNKVWVPEKFFKVILCRQGRPKAIGFIYENMGKKQLMDDAVRSVDEIERLTGIDFFPALDDKTENSIEAQANLSDW